MNDIIICAGAKLPALDQLKRMQLQHPIFVGVDYGTIALLDANIHVDVAVGDFDSVSEEEMSRIQSNVSIIRQYSSIKDDTDLELTLETVMDEYTIHHIYLFGSLGVSEGRRDHLMANMWLVYQPRFASIISKMTFIESSYRVRFYTPGEHLLYDVPKCKYISVVTMTPIRYLKIDQAKYTLESTSYKYPKAFISNEFINSDTPIELSFEDGLVAVMWINE